MYRELDKYLEHKADKQRPFLVEALIDISMSIEDIKDRFVLMLENEDLGEMQVYLGQLADETEAFRTKIFVTERIIRVAKRMQDEENELYKGKK